MTNHDGVPYLVARNLDRGRILYGRYARFEISDERNGLRTVFASPSDGSVSHLVLPPGETVDLFAGQDDSMTTFPVELAPGEYRVRFVYDASPQSEYRGVVTPSSTGVPLPPEKLVSDSIEIRIKG
jgi:hypothetical protein